MNTIAKSLVGISAASLLLALNVGISAAQTTPAKPIKRGSPVKPSAKVQTQASNSDKATEKVADEILNDMANLLWEQGDKYWHDGDYQRVVGLGRIIMEIDPNDEEVIDSMAWLLWSMGDTTGADDLLKYAISKAPKQGMLYSNFGGHLYRTKRYEEAEKYLEQGVKVGGVTSAAYSFLGHTYTKLGKHKEAVDTWRECVKRFPKYPAGLPNLKAAEARLAAAKPK
ncbi:MAG: tetratricopeptide repeat protein [Armatimonadota bacterium]